FVNKIDRRGANLDAVLCAIAESLSPQVVAISAACEAGSPLASAVPRNPADARYRAELIEVLADGDEHLLAEFVSDENAMTFERLHGALIVQTRQALVHPVCFGSAMTGAGVDTIMHAIATFLPPAAGDPAGPLSGAVFKVERGPAGEKIAYVRMFSGTLHVRDRVQTGRADDQRVTALRVFEHGAAVQQQTVKAGQIGKLWGLGAIQIGDVIGATPDHAAGYTFAPPTLETIIVPQRLADRSALHAALAQLAEQDPLINLRHDELHHELFVSLYGEVQKEVIQATLAGEYAIEVEFRESTTICAERVMGVGQAIDLIGKNDNPFLATVGLRIEPGQPNSGITFRLEARLETIPLYVYKSVEEFH
ncbi:MAG TPA: hypothetical protein VFT99_14135, partial [Roseiflexaceae bacterium]|nr:hypothetical protein [Roseiflexaceae bacterium]